MSSPAPVNPADLAAAAIKHPNDPKPPGRAQPTPHEYVFTRPMRPAPQAPPLAATWHGETRDTPPPLPAPTGPAEPPSTTAERQEARRKRLERHREPAHPWHDLPGQGTHAQAHRRMLPPNHK